MESTLSSTPALYVPSGAIPIKTIEVPQIRLGLQGYPGTGKTFSVMKTFPNVIPLNLDNKLGAHITSEGLQIPFHDPEWWLKNKKPQESHKHEGVLRWLQTEGPKFTKQQTLFLDSWTTLMNWFDMTIGKIKFFNGSGKEDGYKFWRLKGEYAVDVVESLKALTCNVVVTFHETVERDDEGRISGLKPMMTGQFADQLAGNFTDWFRQKAEDKLGTDGKPLKDAKGNTTTEYLWQVRSDTRVKCLCSKILPPGVNVVPADYKFFLEK